MIASCHSAERRVYFQSYRRVEIFQDRFTDQYFLADCPGEQFPSIAICEDEIDRRMDKSPLAARS